MPASSRRALFGAMAANLAIAAVKFAVRGLTRSTVMIAEGIHSLVDTGNSALMLLGESRSRRPADEEHPFGITADASTRARCGHAGSWDTPATDRNGGRAGRNYVPTRD